MHKLRYCSPKTSYCSPKTSYCSPKTSYCSPKYRKTRVLSATKKMVKNGETYLNTVLFVANSYLADRYLAENIPTPLLYAC